MMRARFRAGIVPNVLQRVCQMTFYSAARPATEGTSGSFSKMEHKVLERAMKVHVPREGFTLASLAAACEDCGLGHAAAAAFPGGAYRLLEYHWQKSRYRLAEVDISEQPGPESKVAKLVEARLRENEPISKQLKNAFIIMQSSPSNIAGSLGELERLCDEIWALSGDKSFDMTWYYKRLELATLYSAVETYMAYDSSEGHRATYDLAARKLDEVFSLNEVASGVSKYLSFSLRSINNIAASRGLFI